MLRDDAIRGGRIADVKDCSDLQFWTAI